MSTTRGNFSQLLAPGLMAPMFEWLKEHPEEYSQFLSVTTMDGAYDEDQIFAGLGLARLKREGEPVTYDDPIQGGSRRYIPDTYALAWQITEEMMDDDRYGLMRKMPGELMKSCRQSWEGSGASVLNLGFTTVLTADGLSLFNTSHPLLGGSSGYSSTGLLANRLSPEADISITSLQAMLILFENMLNDRGLRMRLEPTNLWIPPDLQFVVGEILQSNYKPFTGNNEVNVMQGRLQPAVLHWLTSTKAWFVSCKECNHAYFKWRKRPVMDSTDDFETKGTKHSIRFRIATGATDWRGWAATTP
jgi:hypothetical protein